jgi:hypothetical protein
LGAAVSLGADPRFVLPAVVVALVTAVGYRVVLQWQSLILTLVLIILFIPIRRYRMPGNLPFQLEPYRLFVAFLAIAWISSLLIDPRVRLRRSGFEGPIMLFCFAALGSVAVVSPPDPQPASDRVAVISARHKRNTCTAHAYPHLEPLKTRAPSCPQLGRWGG